MAREKLLSKYVKLVDHVSPRVVLLRDGSALAMFQVDGLPVQTVNDRLLRRTRFGLNHSLVGLAQNSGIVLFDWVCRGFAPPSIYPDDGDWVTTFGRRTNERYKANLFDRYLFLNRCYRGVLLRPPRLGGERIGEHFDKHVGSKWFARTADDEPPAERVERLNRICEIVETDLEPYRPRRLGWRLDDRKRLFTEIGEALIFAMTGIWRSVGIQAGKRIGQLFSERLIFGDETIEIRGPGYSAWGACFGGHTLPERCPPGTLDGFLTAPFRSTICNSFRLIQQQTSLALMGRNQNRKVSSGDRAHSQIKALDLAMDEVQSGRMSLGDHHMVATVFSDTLPAMKEIANKAWHIMQDAGFQVAREDTAIEGAYASMLPGNSGLRPRHGATTTFNFASMAPMHAFPAGEERGAWGTPLAMFRTIGGTPYRFHPDVNGVRNAFGFGETGSGKTALIAFCVVQCERKGIQCIIIDKDRGLEPTVRFLGGAYLAFDNPTGLAPLKALSSDPEDMNHLSRLIRGLVRGEDGYVMTPEENRRLALGLPGIMALPPADRWMRDVRAFLGVSRMGAGARLERFCWGQEYGGVVDNPVDIMNTDARVLGYDLSKYLNDPLFAGPVTFDVLYRTGKLADGRRLLTIVDEGWRAADIPAFADDIKDGLKTDRKLNAGVWFWTQSVSDAMASSIGPTIREQCPTIFGLAVERTEPEDLKKIKFNDREIEIIMEMRPGRGLFLLKQGNRSAPLHLPLAGLDDELAVLSGNEINVKILDAVREEVGDDDLDLLEERFHDERQKVTA